MGEQAVLTVRSYACDRSGRPNWWIWELTRPGSHRTKYARVRLDRPAELDRLHTLPQRIYELRGVRGGLASIEQELESAGEWLARVGLAQVAAQLRELGPVAVRMRLPRRLADFEALPWELALVDGLPLVRHGVVLVRGAGDTGNTDTTVRGRCRSTPAREDLRFLGLFSLPDTEAALDLGAHRAELHSRLRDLAASEGVGVPTELILRQFGVDQDTLRGLLGEPPGWDVVHVVAHGLPGGLQLERVGGGADFVVTGDLADLLRRGRGTTRLVFLSACWSGSQELDGAPAARVLTSLAARLAEDLGCAVLAMRFPVGNDFALAFSCRLYENLLRHGHTLTRAFNAALRDTADDAGLGEHRHPLFALSAPMIYGLHAPDLRLGGGPTGGDQAASPGGGRGILPRRPISFLGRQREMTAARAAVAPAGGVRGAVLHGASGLGTTTCAVVQAYEHREAFEEVVWHPLPPWEHVARPSSGDPLQDFVLSLVSRLPPGTADAGPADSWSHVAAAVAASRLLVVVDGVDRLVEVDQRWCALLDGVAAGDGPARLLLTSRTDLAGLVPALPRIALPPLAPAEAWQLLLGLPLLGAMARTKEGHITAMRVEDRAAGNPGLLHAAEARAGDPADLARWLRDPTL
ncbi:CHAT domain-containing protein [Streptomyces sp. WAC 04229]|uniref:CHAT domain-containing protein n=1 Tax=Streptomyces sp. WAC 04229 TaxID=2203206 RepID=UPI003D714A1B